MKNQQIRDAQAIMARSPPQLLMTMQQTTNHYRKEDHFLRQTLNSCLSGPVDLQRPQKLELSKELLEHMNASPSWQLGQPTRQVVHIPHESRREAKEERRLTFRPERQPSWLKHDRETLRFYAYFQQPVHESPTENYRARSCLILYYVEDGTMQILEPKIENSGIPQGAFLRRHKFPKADASGFVTMDDLRLGANIEIYGRVFQIVDCDPFTRWFYRHCDIEVGQPTQPLSDNFFENEVIRRAHFLLRRRLVPKDVKESREYTEIMLGGSRKNVGLRQHLDNDRKVLRFYCYWDDKTNYGMRSYYVMHYFLADDSIEIMECYPKNAGKRNFPVFLRRQQLPKDPSTASCPGMVCKKTDFYKPEDFKIGGEITVYNRLFHLYDCDDFTRDFYVKYMNLRQGKEDIVDEPVEIPRIKWKPHVLGISTEEDTLASCLHIVPRRPKSNEKEFLFGDDVTLVFLARFLRESREDEGRRFIISVREQDNTIKVFEVHQKNSGHVGGTFADSGKKINSETGQPYTASDFYVGAIVNINSVDFAIIDADEHTMKHMGNHPTKYPVSDLSLIRTKIAGVLHALK
ncbi:ef hand family protein, partial [Cystoisospora suis]